MEVGEDGIFAAPDILEQEDGAALRLLLDLDHRSGHLVAGVHLAGNGYELIRPVGAHAFEKRGEILSHVPPSPVAPGGPLPPARHASEWPAGSQGAGRYRLSGGTSGSSRAINGGRSLRTVSHTRRRSISK